MLCVAIGSSDVEDNLVYKNLEVRCHVTLVKVTGIKKRNLKNFDESAEKFSDVVLIVDGQKFYVSKLFLASQCTYFESLLLGKFEESQKSEIELKDINPEDMQNFMEILHGEPAINDNTVEGILQLADMYDSKIVIRKCEEFLTYVSTKSLSNKFHLSVRYNFDELKNDCMAELNNVDDLRSIVPEDFNQFSGEVWSELLMQSLALHD